MKLKINLEIPEATEILERLDPVTINPERAGAELAVEKADEQCNAARKELQELSANIEHLPEEVIAGRAPESAVEEMVSRERAQALVLKAREGKLEGARQDLADAQAKARALVIEEGRRAIDLLKKAVAPVIPLLEAVKDLEYEVERLVTAANMNPERGVEFSREQLPAVEWPQCVVHEQARLMDEELLFSRSRKRIEIAPAADHGSTA